MHTVDFLAPVSEVVDLIVDMVGEAKQAAAEGPAVAPNAKPKANDLDPAAGEASKEIKPKVEETKEKASKDALTKEPGEAKFAYAAGAKKAEALSADDKAPIKVELQETPSTESKLDATKSKATAKQVADKVGEGIKDYTMSENKSKADDSSSLIKTERDSHNKAAALRKSALVKIAMATAKRG